MMHFKADEWIQFLFGQIITTFAVILQISCTIVPLINQYLSLKKPMRVLLTVLICGIVIQANIWIFFNKNDENIFTFQRLKRSQLTSPEVVVDQINNIEDAYLNDPEKLSLIEEINKSFVNEATKYYVKIYDLYGDVVDITNYKAKQEILKQAKFNTTCCLHLVFLYGFQIFIPKTTHKLIKFSALFVFLLSLGFDFVQYELLDADLADVRDKILFNLLTLHNNLGQWSPLSKCYTIYEISDLAKRLALLVGFVIVCLANVLYDTNTELVERKLKVVEKYSETKDKIFESIEKIKKEQEEKVQDQKNNMEKSVKFIKVILGQMILMGGLGLHGMFMAYRQANAMMAAAAENGE